MNPGETPEESGFSKGGGGHRFPQMFSIAGGTALQSWNFLAPGQARMEEEREVVCENTRAPVWEFARGGGEEGRDRGGVCVLFWVLLFSEY